jgi:hypothetical protein
MQGAATLLIQIEIKGLGNVSLHLFILSVGPVDAANEWDARG